MNRSSSNLVFLILMLVIPVLFLLDVSLGSVSIPISDIFSILVGTKTGSPPWEAIVWNFRIPKAITAVLVGAGLSVSGLMMQTLFRNPLAGPFVLGVSSGASLGVALVVLASGIMAGILGSLGNLGILAGASIGSFLVLGLIMAVMKKIRESVTVLIIGLMFSYLTSAIVSILLFFSTAEEVQSYVIWGLGSFGGVTWDQLKLLIPLTFAGLTGAFLMTKSLNALLLGENYAKSMGLNVARAKQVILVSTGLLAGGITAFCGPIAFIGIAVAHLARSIFNTSNHRILMPGTLLLGMGLALCCDIISQLPGSSSLLPINAVTSLIGAPIVIWVILKMKNIKSNFVK